MSKQLNNKGFTLIELMIVIAIIGILAAIAIPNFISYRNKTFCSAAESDANSLAAAVANHFAIPTNIAVATGDIGLTLSGNPVNIWQFGTNTPNTLIEIQVTDSSTRCPQDYRDASSDWSGFVYTKSIAN